MMTLFGSLLGDAGLRVTADIGKTQAIRVAIRIRGFIRGFGVMMGLLV